VEVALDLVYLDARSRILTQTGNFESRQGVTVEIIVFQMAVNGDDIRFAIYNAAQSRNPPKLKQPACFVIAKHPHHKGHLRP
jgi:hypothetical protein